MLWPEPPALNSLVLSPSVFYSSAIVRSEAGASVPASGPESEVSGPGTGAGAGTDAAGNARRAEPATGDQGLTPEELEQLSELKARDQEVRTHEAAHQAVGGQYAGAMTLTYQRGPDGVNYAVGGEVSVDVSPVSGDPAATIDKMRVVRAAALAPAEPSAQDRAVAAQAMKTLLEAQSELALENEVSDPVSTEADQQSPESGYGSNQRKAEETYRSVSQMNGSDADPVGMDAVSVSV